MKYELHWTWANGFYASTRKYKRLDSAINAYLLHADMLTNMCSLSEITPDGQGKLLLSKHRSYTAPELKGTTGVLLTVSGDKRKVTL